MLVLTRLTATEVTDCPPADFAGGYALYAFDLSPDLCEGNHFNLVRQGSVRMALTFGESTTRAVTTVAYVAFENIIEVDHSRNILLGFSS